MSTHSRNSLPITVAFLISVPLALQAQTNNGILAGTVLDPSGGAIEGVQITAQAEATSFTLTATTGPDGGFRLASVPIGLYDVTASHPGFGSQTQTGVNVQISTTTSINITLNVGRTEQSVTVEANTTRIETESSDVGTVITDTQVIELPLALGGVGAMRSPEAFVFLAPGTTGPGTANSNNGIFISKIGGGQNFGAEVLLDGTSILRSENGSSFRRSGALRRSDLGVQSHHVINASHVWPYHCGSRDFHDKIRKQPIPRYGLRHPPKRRPERQHVVQ